MLCFHISNQIYIIIQTCMPAHLKIKKNCLIEKIKCKYLVIIMCITFDFFSTA